jgi:DNA-binding transcriptional LysR family regulator
MNARQLEVFRAIMRSGTLTAAAQLPNVSQPAVSKILCHLTAQIEAELLKSVSTSFAGSGAARGIHGIAPIVPERS